MEARAPIVVMLSSLALLCAITAAHAASPETLVRRRGEALDAAERERHLPWQVIILAALSLALLAYLALRQFWKSRRLRVLALTDELTSLANRRNIMAFLALHADAARRSGQGLSVIAFDIDHFKAINDRFGHDGGDRALKALVARAGVSVRATDRLGRVGGEEFLIVLPNTEQSTAVEIAERTRKGVEAAVFDDVAPGLRISISLGVAAWSGDTDSVDALIKRADAALYRAKETGRNRVIISP